MPHSRKRQMEQLLKSDLPIFLRENLWMTATFEKETGGMPEAARRLDDDVLQSAQEAVLANPDAAAMLPGQGDPLAMPASSHGSANGQQRTLARRVSQQPFTAALLAFGAGAVAAALLRSVVRRRSAGRGA